MSRTVPRIETMDEQGALITDKCPEARLAMRPKSEIRSTSAQEEKISELVSRTQRHSTEQSQ